MDGDVRDISLRRVYRAIRSIWRSRHGERLTQDTPTGLEPADRNELVRPLYLETGDGISRWNVNYSNELCLQQVWEGCAIQAGAVGDASRGRRSQSPYTALISDHDRHIAASNAKPIVRIDRAVSRLPGKSKRFRVPYMDGYDPAPFHKKTCGG